MTSKEIISVKQNGSEVRGRWKGLHHLRLSASLLEASAASRASSPPPWKIIPPAALGFGEAQMNEHVSTPAQGKCTRNTDSHHPRTRHRPHRYYPIICNHIGTLALLSLAGKSGWKEVPICLAAQSQDPKG